jgi:hypothetical protein
MAYSCPWGRIPFHKQFELIPTYRSTLTSPIDPFEKHMDCMLAKHTQSFRVKRYSIILNVSCQFDTKAFPDLLEFILVFHFATPLIHFLEFRSKTFTNRFHFRDYQAHFAAAQVKGEPQEVERALFVAFTCLKS